MDIRGEKYPLAGFPRGHILLGPVASLKHHIKNRLFNGTWQLLQEGCAHEDIIGHIKKEVLPKILEETARYKTDMLPPKRLCPAVRELHRAMTEVAGEDSNLKLLRDCAVFLLQEDDAYRFRFQWAAPYLNPRTWWRKLYRAITRKKYSLLDELQVVSRFVLNAEVVPDMKGRIVLLATVGTLLLKDPEILSFVNRVFWEINWKKVYLSRADNYFFRGKYYKVDHRKNFLGFDFSAYDY